MYVFEYYLEIITIRKLRHALSCLRNGSHSLQIDKFRHNNVLYPNMLCKLCEPHAIEDEYRFVYMQCTCYASLKIGYIYSLSTVIPLSITGPFHLFHLKTSL